MTGLSNLIKVVDHCFGSWVILLKNVVLQSLFSSLLNFQVAEPGSTTTLNKFDDASVMHVINMIKCFGHFSKNS